MSNKQAWDVRYHIIDDMKITGQGGSDEDIAANAKLRAEVRKRRYSITCMAFHPGRGSIFCGVTNTGMNILHEFSLKSGKFRSTGFQKFGEDNEVKIHKGLWLDEQENALYFGTATLSDIPKLIEAPGGKLVRYDIDAKKFENLGIPVTGSYIQATNYDKQRQLMYSFSIWDLNFSVWSLKKNKLRRTHPMGSIVHIAGVDDDGGIWGTYAVNKHAFFRYDPDKDSFTCPPDCALPSARKAANLMYAGAGPVDSMINGGDGLMYVGSAMGELYSLDPKTFEIQYLGRPFPANRMPSLVIGADGLIYGVGGDDNATSVFRYDRQSRAFEVLGRVAAGDITCYRPHELLIVGRTAYVGETDNPKRSGYLWECRF